MDGKTEILIVYPIRNSHPSDMEKANVPRLDLVKEMVWVPQTICDQVWVYYRFANKEDRDAFYHALTPAAKKWMSGNFSREWASA